MSCDCRPTRVRNGRLLWSAIGRASAIESVRKRRLPKPPDAVKGIELRGIEVRPQVAARITPVDFNVVTEKWTGPPFDLVIATNVLVYYDRLDQSLAFAGIEAMLRPGGFFLTNNVVVELPVIALAIRRFADRPTLCRETRSPLLVSPRDPADLTRLRDFFWNSPSLPAYSPPKNRSENEIQARVGGISMRSSLCSCGRVGDLFRQLHSVKPVMHPSADSCRIPPGPTFPVYPSRRPTPKQEWSLPSSQTNPEPTTSRACCREHTG